MKRIKEGVVADRTPLGHILHYIAVSDEHWNEIQQYRAVHSTRKKVHEALEAWFKKVIATALLKRPPIGNPHPLLTITVEAYLVRPNEERPSHGRASDLVEITDPRGS